LTDRVLGRSFGCLAGVLLLGGGVGVLRALAAGKTGTKLALALVDAVDLHGVLRENVAVQVGFPIETGVGVELEVLVSNKLLSIAAIAGNAASRTGVADGASSALFLAGNAELGDGGRFVVDALGWCMRIGAGRDGQADLSIFQDAFLGGFVANLVGSAGFFARHRWYS
jgi:hypothetical protein